MFEEQDEEDLYDEDDGFGMDGFARLVYTQIHAWIDHLKQHGIEGSPNDLVVAQTTRTMLVNKIVTLFHAQRLSPSN